MMEDGSSDTPRFIRALRARAEVIRRGELKRAMSRLRQLEPRDRAAVEALTRKLVDRLLSVPETRLREAMGNGCVSPESVRELLGLDAVAEGGEGEKGCRAGGECAERTEGA